MSAALKLSATSAPLLWRSPTRGDVTDFLHDQTEKRVADVRKRNLCANEVSLESVGCRRSWSKLRAKWLRPHRKHYRSRSVRSCGCHVPLSNRSCCGGHSETRQARLLQLVTLTALAGQIVTASSTKPNLNEDNALQMADVRALLAAERHSRRISHPHLTYSKTGALTCTVCDLNIKSEQLWPGHLKSLNHRKNVQKKTETPVRPAKRKIDSIEKDEEQERNYEVDSRKKPKSAPESQRHTSPAPDTERDPPPLPVPSEQEPQPFHSDQAPSQQQHSMPPQVPPAADVDEDEWAAFERDVADVAEPDFATATIEAAPVSAAQLAEQQRTNTVQQREDEAEAEKEDESRRMEEEFDVMEEMEDRVKKLRARREALRIPDPDPEPARPGTVDAKNEVPRGNSHPAEQAATEDSSGDDEDDWYA